MKTILVAATKGGVGKTTLSDELLYSFERTGDSASFYNLDPQKGAAHEAVKREDAVVAVVDTPGSMQDELPREMEMADLIVIPVRASVKDMPAFQSMRRMAGKYAPETPVVIVVNGWTRFTSSREFEEWLRSTQGELEQLTTMVQSEMVPQAAMRDSSVVEYDRPGIASAVMLRAINVIRGAAGFAFELPPVNREGQIYEVYTRFMDTAGKPIEREEADGSSEN